MKLTRTNLNIKEQQSQSYKTKRVTAPALEEIFAEAITLDHGFKVIIIWETIAL